MPPLRMVLSYEKNVFFSCVQKHMKDAYLLVLGSGNEGVDSHQQGSLLIKGQTLNLLHAPNELEAWLLRRLLSAALLRGLQQLIKGYVQGFSKADGDVCWKAQSAALIVGDDDLNQPGTLSQGDLGYAAFLADPCEALAYRLLL